MSRVFIYIIIPGYLVLTHAILVKQKYYIYKLEATVGSPKPCEAMVPYLTQFGLFLIGSP